MEVCTKAKDLALVLLCQHEPLEFLLHFKMYYLDLDNDFMLTQTSSKDYFLSQSAHYGGNVVGSEPGENIALLEGPSRLLAGSLESAISSKLPV